MSAESFPLHWPQGYPRCKVREVGRFQTSLSKAISNVEKSLRMFASDSGRKIDGVILSSNVTLGGLQSNDPGVAAWFTWNGLQVCIPVDRYSDVASNLQAIHHILEARRVELRHGTLALVRASFTGFKALPAPAGKHWRDLLKLPMTGAVSRADVEAQFRAEATRCHPDKGGSQQAMAELSHARDLALAEIG